MKYLINQQEVTDILSFDEVNINLSNLGVIFRNLLKSFKNMIAKVYGKGGSIDIMKEPTERNIARVKKLGNRSISATKQEFIIINNDSSASIVENLINERINQTKEIINFTTRDQKKNDSYWANQIRRYKTKNKKNPSTIKQDIWQKLGINAEYNEETNTFDLKSKEYVFKTTQEAIKFSEDRINIISQISINMNDSINILSSIEEEANKFLDGMNVNKELYANRINYIETIIRDMVESLTLLNNTISYILKTINTQVNALMIHILKWFNPQDKNGNVKVNESTIFQEVKYINDKGNKVPKICPKCGSHVGVYLKGEPVFLCSNKKCSKYFGTVPCNESTNIYQELSFNESDVIVINEGLVEGIVKIISMIINGLNKLLGNNEKKKKSLLDRLNIFKQNKAAGKTPKKKGIFNIIKVKGQPDKVNTPVLDTSIMLVAAIRDAVNSGDPLTMKSVMAKYGENAINIQAKESLEEMVQGFKMEDTHIVQDEYGQWHINFGKAKIEVTEDNIEGIITSRIPILDAINSNYKDKLNKINKARKGLDVAVKMTDESKYPDGFGNWMHRQLNKVNEVFSLAGNNGQSFFDAFWNEMNSIANEFISIEKVDTVSNESNIFNNVDFI